MYLPGQPFPPILSVWESCANIAMRPTAIIWKFVTAPAPCAGWRLTLEISESFSMDPALQRFREQAVLKFRRGCCLPSLVKADLTPTNSKFWQEQTKPRFAEVPTIRSIDLGLVTESRRVIRIRTCLTSRASKNSKSSITPSLRDPELPLKSSLCLGHQVILTAAMIESSMTGINIGCAIDKKQSLSESFENSNSR